MENENIENLSNRWLKEKLDALESTNDEMNIVLESLKRVFADYAFREDQENY